MKEILQVQDSMFNDYVGQEELTCKWTSLQTI